MARIPLAPRPQELNTGNRTVRTPRLEYSGGEAIARGIQVFGDNIVSIFEKKQKADDARVLIEQSLDFDREKLEYMQWRDAPENANDETKWEPEAYNRINRLREKYSQMPLSPEMRLQVDDRLNKWGVNFETEAYAASFRRAGENVRTGLENVKQQSILNRDFSQYNQAIDDAVSRGVYTREGGEALKLDAQATEKSIKIQDLQNNVQADLDVGSFETARIRVQNAKAENLISEAEYNAQISRLDNKIIYNNKVEELEVEVESNPVKVLEEIKNTAASPIQSVPAPLAPYSDAFVKYGNQYGVDPAFLLAISMFETGNGTSSAFRNKNNAMGISDASGPTSQVSVEASIERMAKSIGTSGTYKGANTIEEIAKIYSPPGAGNDPNKTNSLWPKAVRDKYKAVTGQSLPENYSFRISEPVEGIPTTGAGSLSWLAPKDREKVRINAERQVAVKASNQFQTFKEAVDIGMIPVRSQSVQQTGIDIVPTDPNSILAQGMPTEVVPTVGVVTEMTDFDSVIGQEQFKELSADPQSRAAAEYYFNSKYNKVSMNDDVEYAQFVEQISSYDVTKDPSGLAKARLKNNISARFSDSFETELNKRLDDMASVSGKRNSMSKMSDALKQLNKVAFTDQGLGEFKKQTLIEVTGQKDRRISQEDIKANTLLMIDGVRRVPTEADIASGKTTGSTRFIPGVTVKDVNYINIDGKVTEIKKANIVPIYEEDPEKRTQIATQVAEIRDWMEQEVANNPNLSRMELVKMVNVKIAEMRGTGPRSSSSSNPVRRTSQSVNAKPSYK